MVATWREPPLMVTVALAVTVVRPLVFEVRLVLARPPTVVPLVGLREPGPLVMVKVTGVPFGAGTQPEPLLVETLAVSRWLVPMALVAEGGEMVIMAFTQVFWAGALFGAMPLVAT